MSVWTILSPRRPGTPVRLGAVLVVLYVAVAVATAEWAPVRLRPLFDGFASHPGIYNWVKPPKEFAEGNRPPDMAQARIALGSGGSSPVQAETPDGQAMVQLPAGSVPSHASDSAATLEVRPLDSATLGPLPPGLRPEGNAYRVTITYLPSQTPVSSVTSPGVAGVLSEVPSDTLLFSADGRIWRTIEGTPVPTGRGFTAPFTEPGYFLAAGHGPIRPVASSEGGLPVALIVVGAAVPLLLAYLLLSRRRPPSAPSAPPPKRGPSGGRTPAKRKAKPKGKRR